MWRWLPDAAGRERSGYIRVLALTDPDPGGTSALLLFLDLHLPFLENERNGDALAGFGGNGAETRSERGSGGPEYFIFKKKKKCN